MIDSVKFSDEFNKAFKKLKKRYKSLPNDFLSLLHELKENPIQGVALKNGMRKVRISFTSKNRGKSGGGRVIIRLNVSETCLSFLYIYDKQDMSNVAETFLDQLIVEMDNNLNKIN